MFNANDIDSSIKEELYLVWEHLVERGYRVNFADAPNKLFAVKAETVNLSVEVYSIGVAFGTLWRCSSYALQNYGKYLRWINGLNLEAGSAQFCDNLNEELNNQNRALSIQLWYFGKYEKEAFENFFQSWDLDVKIVWGSKERFYFLT